MYEYVHFYDPENSKTSRQDILDREKRCNCLRVLPKRENEKLLIHRIFFSDTFENASLMQP